MAKKRTTKAAKASGMAVKLGERVNLRNGTFPVAFGVPLGAMSSGGAVLGHNQAILVEMGDGKLVVVSRVNVAGGVCDDCESQFQGEKVKGWRLVTFESPENG